jgi:hypothetical protein
MIRESQQRGEEEQRTKKALSAKTGPSDFINRILPFFQTDQFLEKQSPDSFASHKTFNLA